MGATSHRSQFGDVRYRLVEILRIIALSPQQADGVLTMNKRYLYSFLISIL